MNLGLSLRFLKYHILNRIKNSIENRKEERGVIRFLLYYFVHTFISTSPFTMVECNLSLIMFCTLWERPLIYLFDFTIINIFFVSDKVKTKKRGSSFCFPTRMSSFKNTHRTVFENLSGLALVIGS